MPNFEKFLKEQRYEPTEQIINTRNSLQESKSMYEKKKEFTEQYPNHRNNPVESTTFNNFYKTNFL